MVEVPTLATLWPNFWTRTTGDGRPSRQHIARTAAVSNTEPKTLWAGRRWGLWREHSDHGGSWSEERGVGKLLVGFPCFSQVDPASPWLRQHTGDGQWPAGRIRTDCPHRYGATHPPRGSAKVWSSRMRHPVMPQSGRAESGDRYLLRPLWPLGQANGKLSRKPVGSSLSAKGFWWMTGLSLHARPERWCQHRCAECRRSFFL